MSRNMRSEDLSTLQLQLKEAGVLNASDVLGRLLYWTNGRKSQTATLIKKIQERPQADWTQKDIDDLVERTYLWPEIKGVLQQGRIGKAIDNHPHKIKLVETYLDILNRKQVQFDTNQPLQKDLIQLGLLHRVDDLLQPSNRIYASIFDSAWGQGILEKPPIWEDVQEFVKPWLTARNVILTVVAVAVLLGGVFILSRPQPELEENTLLVAQLTSPTPTATVAAATATATTPPTSEPVASPTPMPATATVVPTATLEPQLPPTEQVQSKPAVDVANETKTIGATPKPTAMITATVISTNTVEALVTEKPTQQVTERVFIQPQLLNLHCYEAWETYAPNGQIGLRWSWNGWLGWNEYLEIRVGPNGGNLTSIGKVFADPNGSTYEWFITPQGYFLDGTTENYQWQVVHMAANGRTVLARSPRGCFTVN